MLKRLALALIFSGAFAAASAEEIVRAGNYDAYWLWAGVRERPEIAKARVVYLLQGEIGADAAGHASLKAQGGSEPGPHAPTLWLVYRVRSLDWPPEVLAAILRRYETWRAAPGHVAGLQIDFDASTRGLRRYAAFLRDLKQALPEGCALSVTGLMDWASQASPEDIDALAGAVDEIIFQTYRGRETIANLDAYLARLGRVKMPFRLGLSEGAAWPGADALALPSNFLGYVVFLRNLPGTPR